MTCALQEDVQALEFAAEEGIGDVDILLTCEWPADVTAATPPGSAPADASTAGESCVQASLLIAMPNLTHQYCSAVLQVVMMQHCP